MQPNQNAQAAMALLQQRGYNPVQAAGITGNLMQESSVNPMTRPGDHGTAHGIAQWRGDRWSNALRYAQQTGGNINSLATQIGYLDQELRTRYPRAYQALMSARTPEQAAGAFGLHYERPRGAETGVAQNIDGYTNRANVARALVGMPGMSYADASAVGNRGPLLPGSQVGMGMGEMDAPARDPRARAGALMTEGPIFAPGVDDGSGGYRHGSGDVEDPGGIDLAGGGGGGGGVESTPGSNDTDLGGASAGAGPLDASIFNPDQTGFTDINNRLASIKQNAAMGQGADIGEITPLAKAFDLARYDSVGAAGRRQA